jgi:hypothetical protein
MTVQTIDHGWNDIIQNIKEMDNSYTKVGFPSEGKVGEADQSGSDHELADEISEVAQIGAWQEWGTVHISARPFMSTSFDENRKQLQQVKVQLYDKIVTGKMSTMQALGIIGEFMEGKVKKKIREIKTPANKPSTERRKKGANNPLIDMGQMRNSVQHVEVKIV